MVPGFNTARVTRALATVAAIVLVLAAAPVFAGSISLAWNPVVAPGLAGYKIHVGPAAGTYTTSIDVGNSTTHTVPNLNEGATYHFAVTSYDTAGTQSAFSTDLAAAIPYSKPVAQFSASTTSGAAPLAMNFVNASTGVITTHAWTFGDGTSSSAANPTHVYSVPGVYSVALTVTGPGGTSTRTQAGYITVTGSPSDTSPPGAPSSLTATPSGATTINVAWAAATDNVGVTGYRVERCQGASCTNFAQITSTAARTLSNTGLAPGTTYRYRVRAHDAAGNLGGYSPIAAATTATAADTSPPGAPSSLTATPSGATTINVAWAAATDNVGVTGYRVERCQGASCTNFAQITSTAARTLSNTGLAPGTTYRYRVRAHDAAGNLGGYSPIAAATTATAADTSPPGAPSNLTATTSGATTINVAWGAATDNVGVTGYRVERCTWVVTCTNVAQIATTSALTLSDTGVVAYTIYLYRVRAYDAAGNVGAYSSFVAGYALN